MNKLFFGLLTVLIVLGGCARGESNPNPPDIVYGEDLCAECNMIISDARFAAGYAYEVASGRYESKAFDDIGDMLIHAEKNPSDNITAWYVHDYNNSDEWLDATHATFVVSLDLPTPMGFGILAFAEMSDAQTVAGVSGGKLLTWDELRDEELDARHGH